MNQKQIDELKKLAAKATPGPWVANTDGDGSLCEAKYPDGERHIIIEPAERDDAEYISAVNPLVLFELLASYERLEKEADWLACQFEKKEHGCEWREEKYECRPSEVSCGYQGPDNWREAARKAVEKLNANS